jgi:hypothetical protein
MVPLEHSRRRVQTFDASASKTDALLGVQGMERVGQALSNSKRGRGLRSPPYRPDDDVPSRPLLSIIRMCR